MATESEKLANTPPTEKGFYWVSTNPAWRDNIEVVYIGYPEYDDRLHVYNMWEKAMPLEEYCKKFPRKWFDRLEYHPKW